MVIEAAAPLLGDARRLLIVGKGDERAHLEQVARRFGVADRVIFAGERHDVAAMLSAMDLFVAASKQETFGLSVLEALANGAPVLYTTCPALDGLDVSRATQVPSSAGGLRDAHAGGTRRGAPARPGDRAGRGEGIRHPGRHLPDRRPVRAARIPDRVAHQTAAAPHIAAGGRPGRRTGVT